MKKSEATQVRITKAHNQGLIELAARTGFSKEKILDMLIGDGVAQINADTQPGPMPAVLTIRYELVKESPQALQELHRKLQPPADPSVIARLDALEAKYRDMLAREETLRVAETPDPPNFHGKKSS